MNTESTPYQPILDREELPTKVAEAYADALWLLRDVVSYGSWLIPQCYGDSPDRTIEDAVILLSMGKHGVAMLDGIEILVSRSALLASFLQARSLLETSISMDWVLLSETKKKCLAYYIGELRDQLRWAKAQIPATEEFDLHAAMRETIAKGPSGRGVLKQLEAQGRDDVDRIEEYLRNPRFDELMQAFDKKRGSRRFDRPWHAVVGATSVRAMAKEVDRLAEYDAFYGQASKTMHGSSYRQHFQIHAQMAVPENNRSPVGIDTLLRISLAASFRIFRSLLRRYRPDEEANFSHKYTHDWMEPFRGIKGVALEFTLEETTKP